MNAKDFNFFKKNLKDYFVIWVDNNGFYVNTICVVAKEGEYNISKNDANETYSVEYIPYFGSKEFSVHFTKTGVIEYIKGGDKYVE